MRASTAVEAASPISGNSVGLLPQIARGGSGNPFSNMPPEAQFIIAGHLGQDPEFILRLLNDNKVDTFLYFFKDFI